MENNNNYCEIIFDKKYFDKELAEYYILNSPYGIEKSSTAIKKSLCEVLPDKGIKVKVKEDWQFQFKSNGKTVDVDANRLQKLISQNNTFLNQNYSISSNTNNYSVIEGETDNSLFVTNNKNLIKKDNEIVKFDTAESTIAVGNLGSSIKNAAIKMEYIAEAEHFCDMLENDFPMLSKSEQDIYMKYIASERERLYVQSGQNDWYDYITPIKEWSAQQKAEQKIKTYTNNRAYEQTLPYPLRTRKQFVLWKWCLNDKKDKAIKMPINPWNGDCAISTDSSTWATFDKCLEMYNKHGKRNKIAGIGIMLGKGVIGIDFDKCINADGVLDSDKAQLVASINSYTEYSPSGDGLHILAFGKLPEGYLKRNDAAGIECYESGRFFTLTGEVYNHQSKMCAASETEVAIQKMMDKYMQKPILAKQSVQTVVPTTGTQIADDKKVIELIRKSKLGDEFAALFDRGEVPKNTKGILKTQLMRPKGAAPSGELKTNEEILRYYEMDNSRCDARLCGIIAGYTDDLKQIDRIYRKSALMRDKWDSLRGDKTYGNNLCEYVLKNRQFRYDKNFGKQKLAQKKTNLRKNSSGSGSSMGQV